MENICLSQLEIFFVTLLLLDLKVVRRNVQKETNIEGIFFYRTDIFNNKHQTIHIHILLDSENYFIFPISSLYCIVFLKSSTCCFSGMFNPLTVNSSHYKQKNKSIR